MSTTQISVPFIDALRQQWLNGQISRDDALSQIASWELDPDRDDEELEASFAFKQDVTGAANLPSAPELEVLVKDPATLAQHLPDVMHSLEQLAAAGQLGDPYAPVLRQVIAGAGSGYRDQIRGLLLQQPALSPALEQALLDTAVADPAALTHYGADARQRLEQRAAAGELDDTHAPVLERMIALDPAYEEPVRQLLEPLPTRAPALQALLDRLQAAPGGASGPGGSAAPGPAPASASPSGTPPPGTPPPGPTSGPPPGGGVASAALWGAVEQAMALGLWQQAKQALQQIPPTDPKYGEVPRVAAAIAEGTLLDQMPELRAFPTRFASTRSRRDWVEFARRRGEVEQIVSDAATRTGQPLRIPASLQAIFDDGESAQAAEEIVKKAVEHRSKGEFFEAGTMLNEAAGLDGRYPRIVQEQGLNTTLQGLLDGLRTNPLSKADELAAGQQAVEELLQPGNAPDSPDAATYKVRIDRAVDQLVERNLRYIQGRERALRDLGNLDDKLQTCDEIESRVREIELVRHDEPTLPDIRTRLTNARTQLTSLVARRNQVVDGINQVNAGGPLDPAAIAAQVDEVEALLAEPLAEGDTTLPAAAQILTSKLNSYLSTQLPGTPDQPTLEQCAELLRLAGRGPRPLARPQAEGHSRAIWRAGASVVRDHLNRYRALPAYDPTRLRSQLILDEWDQARRTLEWLRGLVDIPGEPATLAALDGEFARSVEAVLADAANLPPKLAPGEAHERRETARAIKQYIPTLPPTVRTLLPADLETKPTGTETALNRRRTLQNLLRSAGAGFVVITVLALTAALWPRLTATITDINATPTPIPTGTPVPTATPVPTPTWTPIPSGLVIPPEYLRAQPPQAGCPQVNGFNICNNGDIQFADYYDEVGQALLGPPLTAAFDDTWTRHYIQVFALGLLEKPGPANGRSTLIHLGDDLFRELPRVAARDAAYSARPACPPSTAERTQQHNFAHCMSQEFLDFYLKNPLGQPWRPADRPEYEQFGEAITYYGLPITEEYDDQFDGQPVRVQFFQRAVFERRANGQMVRWPVGALYLHYVRLAKDLPIPTVTPR
jgi:hypothetical protein